MDKGMLGKRVKGSSPLPSPSPAQKGEKALTGFRRAGQCRTHNHTLSLVISLPHMVHILNIMAALPFLLTRLQMRSLRSSAQCYL